MKKFPELTFVPIEYANSSKANLTIFTKKAKLIHPNIKEPFFVFWVPLNLSEEILAEAIESSIEKFPLDKSLTCYLNLAYPKNFLDQEYADPFIIGSESMILGKTIAKIVPIEKVIDILVDLPLVSLDLLEQIEYSYSMYFWSLATKLAIQLIAKGSYVPVISRTETDQQDNDFYEEQIGTMQSCWMPILKTEKDLQIFKRILEYSCLTAHNIPLPEETRRYTEFTIPELLTSIFVDGNAAFLTSQIYSVSVLCRSYIEHVVDFIVRTCTDFEGSRDIHISWELRLVDSLLSESRKFAIYDVKEEIIPKIFERWSQRMNLSWNLGYSLKFHLKSPHPRDTEGEWNLVFLLHGLTDSLDYSLQELWDNIQKLSTRVKLNHFSELVTLREYILKSLNILSRIFMPIGTALREKYPSSIPLTTTEVLELLQSGISEIKSYGYTIEIPETFSLGGSQRIQPVLTIDSSEISNTETITPKNIVSFDISSVLAYEWNLKIGESFLSEEESKRLLDSEDQKSLLYWNDQWIMVDIQSVKQLRKNKQSLKGSISGVKALKLALTQNAYLETGKGESLGPYPVQFFGPLEDVLNIIKGGSEMPYIPQPEAFSGKLRKYQEYGYNWIRVLTSIGFGCVLADDMGLGKTIQIIALILSILQEKNETGTFLVICPTSVLGNWIRELEKFAPTIKATLHYGLKRAKNLDALNTILTETDVILTSYNILRRDIDLLEVIKWESVVIDESQNIKNYRTKQAKAVYRLVDRTQRKIALSGTPIENQISELWSLFHFVNPFLFGSRSQFMARYAVPVGKLGSEALTTELRNLVNPFLLRRMKTNKQIIPELPDKQETELYITLTTEQKHLYKNVVDSMLKEVEAIQENSKQKFHQKGLILKALMQLKQICNHPNQFLHTSLDDVKHIDESEFIKKSGKLRRFIEVLEEALASKNKILIFTQFKVMGDYLQYIIEQQYHLRIPFIHGGVQQEDRTRLVMRFQEDESYQWPILLLSLRAGGVGLNLSKASVVIHYDRWWNPAVEDQATDRAYRIGQENKVFVYKMVAEGTVEERISKMLEEKRTLAESIIEVTGEEWITELSFGELKDMFRLKEEEY